MEDKIPTMEDCKKCEHYIEWECEFGEDLQPYPCASCRSQGQSYDINFENCPLKTK